MQTYLASYIRNLSRPAEIVIVVMIFAGWFMYASIHTVLAGFPTAHFDDDGMLWLVAFEIVLFAIAWSFLRLRGWRLSHFNIELNWSGVLVGALLFGVSLLLDALIWSLFAKHGAAREIVEEIHRTKAVSAIVVLTVSGINGAFEEFFLTGYLLKVLRSAGASAALGVSALVRLSYHLYQGPLGALTVMAFGILLTAFYWRYRRLWPVICAHILADVIGLS
jgi:membrane protease YdiL (CAAX protease family)